MTLKEGIYQDFANRDLLLDLLQFKSTKEEGYTDFAQYKDRMPDGQKAIYYIIGENEQGLRHSPLLEPFRQKNIEVLIMDDDIDEIVIPALERYKDIKLKAVNRSDTIDEIKTEEEKKKEKASEPLLARMRKVLADDVKDVRAGAGLSESPSCIVADEDDPTIGLQQILKVIGEKNIPEAKPILEVNPDHPIIKSLESTKDERVFEDASRLLFEQALLVEGVRPKDTASFIKRLNRVLEKAL
jgi:molecular chaperone HtpG